VPGHTADAFPRCVELIAAGGHEIAHHGYCHEPPARLSASEEEAVLIKGIEALRRITGERPNGYRAPLWEPSDRTLRLLEREGFLYDSSLMARDFEPYHPRIGDKITADQVVWGRPSSIVEMPSSWVVDDWGQIANISRTGGGGVAPPGHVLEVWREYFEYAYEQPQSTFVVFTAHPQATGHGHGVRILRRLLDDLRSREGVTFLTMPAAWRRRGGSRAQRATIGHPRRHGAGARAPDQASDERAGRARTGGADWDP